MKLENNCRWRAGE